MTIPGINWEHNSKHTNNINRKKEALKLNTVFYPALESYIAATYLYIAAANFHQI